MCQQPRLLPEIRFSKFRIRISRSVKYFWKCEYIIIRESIGILLLLIIGEITDNSLLIELDILEKIQYNIPDTKTIIFISFISN